MQFETRALDEATQRMVSATVEALDEVDARAQLRARRLVPVALQPRTALRIVRTRQTFRVDLFAQELHAMVNAGLGLVESMEALIEKERVASTRVVLRRLVDGVRGGARLSAAMRLQAGIFPPLFLGIVEAAENTGELASALERYLSYAHRVQEVRQRMVSACIYPVILIGAGSLVGMLLMFWVVPRFASVYRSGGRSLPWASQVLLDWGQFAGSHATALLAALSITMLALIAWVASVSRRDAWSRVAAWVPGVARWLDLLSLSRLYLTLGLLLRGGLPLQQALGLSRSVLPGHRQNAVNDVNARVAEGLALSTALDMAGLATPIALRFVRAGERSGQVADMLNRAAAYHDAETSRWVERFSRVFEPVLMAAIGLVIGLIVLLLYMPIFDLAGGFQ